MVHQVFDPTEVPTVAPSRVNKLTGRDATDFYQGRPIVDKEAKQWDVPPMTPHPGYIETLDNSLQSIKTALEQALYAVAGKVNDGQIMPNVVHPRDYNYIVICTLLGGVSSVVLYKYFIQ